MQEHDEARPESGREYNRRDFLKLAGVAGAVVGVGGGLGGLLAACGGGTTTTSGAATTQATTATTSAPTTASTAGATTTASQAETTTSVAASGEKGSEIKLGWVSPLTGALATFGTADKYCLDRWNEVVKDGWKCSDGKIHPINIVMKDTQSDGTRAAQVAGELINTDKVDIMMVASTPDTVAPVAAQAEAAGTPCFSNDAPWQAYYYGGLAATDEKPPKWSYHHFWGMEDVVNVYLPLWARFQTNKVVGVMWPNDADGNAFSDAKGGFPPAMEAAGYKIIDPGRYQNGTEDFTSMISQFKSAGAEIVTGVLIPPDFTNFWKQSMQQGFKPKIATIAKAVDLPAGWMALGDAANNFTLETQWTPRCPFKSSLTGETCQQIADDFETKANQQWAQYLLHYGVFEVVADALKRSKNPEDKEANIAAIASTKLDTIAGPVDFTTVPKQGTPHPVKNVVRSPLVAGQWTKGFNPKWTYDLAVVDNTNNSSIKVDADPKPIV